MKDNVPSPLSMKEMKNNGLDFSIQDEIVRFKNAEQDLVMENYFLVRRWRPEDLGFCVIHRVGTTKALSRIWSSFCTSPVQFAEAG